MDGTTMTGAGAAVWLGLLTAVSPCPLATHVAALSFITRDVAHPRRVWQSGIAYALGRMLTYTVLASVATVGLLSTVALSDFTQHRMNQVLGPVLILVALGLWDVVPWPSWGLGRWTAWTTRLADGGSAGAAGLGALFALAFCPVSAALFFGSLVPLAAAAGSIGLYPALYGLASALPVAILATGVALGARWAAGALRATARLEAGARAVTAATLLVVGVYLCLTHLYGL